MHKATDFHPNSSGAFIRILALVLFCTMLLSAGCTSKTPEATNTPETNAPVQTKPATEATTEPDEEDVSIYPFRQAMVETPQVFAAAYFGYADTIDSDEPVDPFAVMEAEAPQLCADLPFLLTIPDENIVGARYGELFCIVPRDPNATVAVNRGIWNESSEVYDYTDVIYRSESGAPILLFCNNAGWEPDTQVVITESDGTSVTWYPRINRLRWVDTLRNEAGEELLWDFTPYVEILRREHQSCLDSQWDYPTVSDLFGVDWSYGFGEDSYQVTFRDDVCDVRWTDGAESHEYPDAPWQLDYAEGFAILTIDFGEFAGVKRYNVLIHRELELLYIAMDISDESIEIGWDSLYQWLTPAEILIPPPEAMVGAWDLIWTEVEGYRNQEDPGNQTVIITADGAGLYWIDFIDRDFPDWSYDGKELVVFPEALYYSCRNDQWSATVNYVNSYGTQYSLTLLDDGTLLMQQAWEMEGAPMVSYSCFQRSVG